MTNRSNKPKSKHYFLETGIIISIACCVIFLNIFTTSKFNDLEKSAKDAVFVMDEVPISENDEFTEQVKEYIPDTYKMIELYDENLDLLFQIQFESDQQYQHNDIREYEDITSVIKSTPEGQSKLISGDVEQDFFYKWVENNRGEVRLLIVYSKVEIVRNLWVFSFVCYLIIILIFILLIRIHIRHYKDQISKYNDITRLSSTVKSN